MQLSFRSLAVGAEVIGLNAGDEYRPDVRAALYDAWLVHGILLFKHVDTTIRHLALSRCFGDLELHPLPEVRSDEDPLLIEIGGAKRARAYVYDDHTVLANRIAWHRDTAYTPAICKGAMLRMVDVPARGGETLFADTARAYDDLSASVRASIDRLEYKASLRVTPMAQTRPGAFWQSVRPATAAEDPQSVEPNVGDEIASRYPAVVHPVVLVHPESGRRCLFLSPTYVDAFIGLSQAESDDLLRYLVAHMLQPRYVYTHTWSANEAIVWDNRRVLHAALGNTPDQSRRGLRTTLAGALRTGRYFGNDMATSVTPLADG